MRQHKRKILRSKGLTFQDRVREAIRTHKPIQGINWTDKPEKPDVRTR